MPKFRTSAVAVSGALAMHLFLPLLFPSSTVAAKTAPTTSHVTAQSLKRDVLGLYDSRTETTAKLSRLHKYLEMPLNHLGYRLILHDISKGLPPLDTLTAYHAVATWFSGEIPEGKSFVLWAARVARSGTRFVVLDSVGLLGAQDELPLINGFLSELGIAYVDYYVSASKETRIAAADELIGFEAKLDPIALPDHQVVNTRSPKTTVHLSVTDPAHRAARAKNSALVTTNAKGGFASTNYVMQQDAQTDTTRWIINPFAFLEAALGSSLRPIPDTTTISGRRIYFSHIDGDGWNNATSVEPYASKRETSAAVLLDKLIVPYPDLPVTVGFIAGDGDPALGGTLHGADLARRIFSLPQVEPASHTCTHPYHWAFYEKYDRKTEIERVLRFANVQPNYDDRALATLVRRWRSERSASPADAAPKPSDGESSDLPRARPEQPFSLELEVNGALKRTSRLAPPSKPVKLYLWSGDTTPFENVVKAARDAEARNLNGGDSRLDSSFPSVAYVPPVGVAVGAERQIYAVNSNENTYTNGWTGPFDAFKQLTETLDNTERPRRLKGFNLYYHSFSATRPEGVDAVTTHLERARHESVTPITASRYAAIADGFYTTEITPVGLQRWRISNRDALGTVRFDRADTITIDYAASVGVVGHNRHLGSLYVALDHAVPEPIVATMAAAASRPSLSPYLVQSRWIVSNIDRQTCRTTATMEGYGKGTFEWAGFPRGDYAIVASRHGKTVHQSRAIADQAGNLSFEIPANAIDSLRLTISCIGEATPKEPSIEPPITPLPLKSKSLKRSRKATSDSSR